MKEKRTARWIGEFVVIALGVLVALGVDDWRQRRADRELEGQLVERLARDIRADAADLARAQRAVARRYWVIEAATAGRSDVRPQRTGANFFDPVRVDSVIASVGRTGAPWDSLKSPLSAFADNIPDFDLFDDTYREMLATGSLDVVTSLQLRTQILSYYRIALDQGDNARRAAPYQQRLEDALSEIDVATGDAISLSELQARISADPSMHVALRQARVYVRLQLSFFRQADAARLELEQGLEEWRRERGGASPGG